VASRAGALAVIHRASNLLTEHFDHSVYRGFILLFNISM
jgi:hypothetical protein